MIQPVLLLVAVASAFFVSNAVFGYDRSYAIGYGAFTLMAILVAATFFWLWVKRATPLAMGMFFGWAGAAGVMGWWWSFNLLEHPDWMVANPALFLMLSAYFVGAVLHFKVIWHSFGLKGMGYVYPVAGSLVLSVLLQYAI